MSDSVNAHAWRVWILSVGATALSACFWLGVWLPAAAIHGSVSVSGVEVIILLHLAALAPGTAITARQRTRAEHADGGGSE